MSEPLAAEHQPYRDPAAGDIVLCTSDGIEFHVHRRRLADASPFFADMFSLPQSPGDAEEKPIIPVSEASVVWEKLLPFCYLAEEPPIALDDVRLLLEAGRKYEIVSVICRMRSHLFHPTVYGQSPFAIYALACAAGCTDAARAAARRTLDMPIYPEYAKEFACVSGIALYNLFEYRRMCGIAASDVVLVTDSNKFPEWMRTSMVLQDMKTCGLRPCADAGRTAYILLKPGECVGDVRRTFFDYMKQLHEALKLRPQGSLASSPELLDPIIASALDCKTCSRTIYKNTTRCAKVLEAKIEEAIAKVELVVEA